MAPACPLVAERGSIGVLSELWGPRTEVGPAYLGLGERPGCWWRWELGCSNWKAFISSLKACQRAPPTGLPRWCRDESHSPPGRSSGQEPEEAPRTQGPLVQGVCPPPSGTQRRLSQAHLGTGEVRAGFSEEAIRAEECRLYAVVVGGQNRIPPPEEGEVTAR